MPRAYQGLKFAEALDHPHVLAYTLHAVSIYHLWRCESQTALDLAERSAALCREIRIPFWQATVMINRGHALALRGHTAQAEADLHRALAVARQQQTRFWELREARALPAELAAA